jgi:hypothetical protein
MLDTAKNVYMLSTWSIEKRKNGWFIYRTPFFDDAHHPKGPYSTIMSACLMIARELAREAVRRHQKN